MNRFSRYPPYAGDGNRLHRFPAPGRAGRYFLSIATDDQKFRSTSKEPATTVEIKEARVGSPPVQMIFYYQGHGPLGTSHGTSDAEGYVQLAAAESNDGDVFFRVESEHHPKTLVPVATNERMRTDFVVKLAASGSLQGRLPLAIPYHGNLVVGLVPHGAVEAPEGPRPRSTVGLSQDGSFRISRIPIDTWDLVLFTNPGRQALGTLTTVRTTPDEPTTLGELPYSGPWPGRVSGTVTIDGTAPIGAVVRATARDGSVLTCTVGHGGEWNLPALAPGEYDVKLILPDGEQTLAERTAVPSGGEIKIDKQL